MKKFNEKWKELLIRIKVIHILRALLGCIVIIVSISGLLGKFDIKITNSIAIPILGLVIFLSGILTYKKNKLMGILNFCCATFILIVSIVILI